MPICKGCGANIKHSTPDCPFCGTRNSVDFHAVSDSTTEIPQEERICPNCEKPLKSIDIGEGEHFYIENCDSCGGLFFDTGELQAILDQQVRGAVRINHMGLDRMLQETLPSTLEVKYRRCPICGEIMNREKFGEKSGVIVDHCHAHGIWLEPGELTRLKEWKKEGGEILDAKRRYQEQEQKLKEERARYRNADDGAGYTSGAASGYSNSSWSFGETNRNGDLGSTLFDVIADIASSFFRGR